MKNIRLLHRYLGLFFSPAILFFTFSGALQTFNLHEQNKSTGYLPPAWVVEMAQLHKKQITSLPKEKSRQTPPEPTPRDSGTRKIETPSRNAALPLKCFVLAMSVGLFATTLMGIYMGFRYCRNRPLVWGMLVGGTLLPIVMIYL
jgi:hypothetical protein